MNRFHTIVASALGIGLVCMGAGAFFKVPAIEFVGGLALLSLMLAAVASLVFAALSEMRDKRKGP